ncbi:predicted protein [Histoplasma mississippiense (nom. inval.)]|uniref:predicted protein n=1 Tax=Ajellomyces capsulatus (strain NAm1 / WU24) TaxID=2059318 RepID=UPI000157BFE9|nr:predicted protein [Histoplasma mississippiense (nom. inval.)]EDN06399.1 predicted protein [Histoplasma mississippiense (nom. inval.)]
MAPSINSDHRCFLSPPPSFSAIITKALSIVYALIFGFASSSNISLTPGCVGQLCHLNDFGRPYTTCYTVVSFGTLTGVPIAGGLIRATGGPYWDIVIWAVAPYTASLGCFIWSPVLAAWEGG